MALAEQDEKHIEKLVESALEEMFYNLVSTFPDAAISEEEAEYLLACLKSKAGALKVTDIMFLP